MWGKAGATNTEVVKALLECGDTSPRAPFHGAPNMTLEQSVMMSLCMEADGFRSNYENSTEGFCKRNSSVNPPILACRRGTQAPARNVNKRINSVFCHVYPKADVCAP